MAVLIIFPVILQTVINLIMLSIEGQVQMHRQRRTHTAVGWLISSSRGFSRRMDSVCCTICGRSSSTLSKRCSSTCYSNIWLKSKL